MRRASIRGRRGALAGATAAVVCLGGLLAACGSSGGGDGDGYVAVGAAGATPDRTANRTVAPTGDVELVPLDGAAGSSGPDAKSPGDGGSSGDGSGADSSGGSSDAGAGSGSGSGSDSGSGSGSRAGTEAGTGDASGAPEVTGPDGGAGTGSPGGGDGSGGSTGGSAGGSGGGSAGGSSGGAGPSPSAPRTGTPGGPAVLKVGDPVRKATDQRWCEDVTLTLHNSGGSAVRSGKVTFGTHIIGALGIDWSTVESTRDLPVPIDAGKTKKKTWTVCVDAWRVPIGMHVETRDVSVEWK
ncbi:hypothetical protein ACFVTY_36940 [Streptomyces sp. NPDC058067]|uniref:hypothetical protein n=1 Tax=Streptomyces sp. NPDC058067 TaxID=3346324 RepID=UPI0036F0A932